MAYVLGQLYNVYRTYLVEYSDPRTDDLPLINSPLIIFAICASYLYIVLSFGPRFMKDRAPFQIKSILIVYNAFQIVANIFVWIYIFKVTYYQGTFNLSCNSPTPQNDRSENAMHQVLATYCYFLLKVLDLLDTLFFIARKKFSHVTFLHVYHHTGMVFGGFIASRFCAAGHGTMLGILNCFVHAVMYGYYLFSALDENVKKSIWWKKHITQIQLTQFLLLGVHFSICIFVADCTYPKLFCIIMALQNLFMMFMFGDFYRKTYLLKKME
ncbi:elongation of very long chain fatty acids protein AAEL008004-like [Sitodiplosis mosellana]|uniref:elongation of very long chain fatty acids protein AAEL008004-like n=1 Tax=Sitodiplosis mosellana TaxID=263140 RepID=UPI002444F1E4|nr:elongation of very long chain fatty acids protein AAEL008004-like [Sitodiplosis mosellana]